MAKSSGVTRTIKVRSKDWSLYEVDLYRLTAKGLSFLPKEGKRVAILAGLHDLIGPWSFATTYKIIFDRFWWSGIRPEATHLVMSCDACQRTNPSEQNLPYGRMPVSGPFHTCCIDFAGPLEETVSGKKYVLLAVVHFSNSLAACTAQESLSLPRNRYACYMGTRMHGE